MSPQQRVHRLSPYLLLETIFYNKQEMNRQICLKILSNHLMVLSKLIRIGTEHIFCLGGALAIFCAVRKRKNILGAIIRELSRAKNGIHKLNENAAILSHYKSKIGSKLNSERSII